MSAHHMSWYWLLKGLMGCLIHCAFSIFDAMFPPVQAVAVSLADDDVIQSIAIHVGDENGYAGVAEVEFAAKNSH